MNNQSRCNPLLALFICSMILFVSPIPISQSIVQAETIDQVPAPAGFAGPAPGCNCMAGDAIQTVYHNPSNMNARMTYDRGDGWQTIEFEELAGFLGNHPTEIGCASFITGGLVRTLITYMGRDKSGGFGMFTLVIDFPAKGEPEVTDTITHTLYAEPNVDVLSSSVDYDQTTGRLAAAGIVGDKLTYFNAGLDSNDLVTQVLPDLSGSFTSADYPKSQVDVSTKTVGRVYLIIFDAGEDRIFYRTSLDGMAGKYSMVAGTWIMTMEGTSGSGPVSSQVEANPRDGGLWVTYHDDDGTQKSFPLIDHLVIGKYKIFRRGNLIVAVWEDKSSGEVKIGVYNIAAGKLDVTALDIQNPQAGDLTDISGGFVAPNDVYDTYTFHVCLYGQHGQSPSDNPLLGYYVYEASDYGISPRN